jgi:hypothetical protein
MFLLQLFIAAYCSERNRDAIDERTRATLDMRKALRLRKMVLTSIFVIRSQQSPGVR